MITQNNIIFLKSKKSLVVLLVIFYFLKLNYFYFRKKNYQNYSYYYSVYRSIFRLYFTWKIYHIIFLILIILLKCSVLVENFSKSLKIFSFSSLLKFSFFHIPVLLSNEQFCKNIIINTRKSIFILFDKINLLISL